MGTARKNPVGAKSARRRQGLFHRFGGYLRDRRKSVRFAGKVLALLGQAGFAVTVL
jgi:hypothetical protein